MRGFFHSSTFRLTLENSYPDLSLILSCVSEVFTDLVSNPEFSKPVLPGFETKKVVFSSVKSRIFYKTGRLKFFDKFRKIFSKFFLLFLNTLFLKIFTRFTQKFHQNFLQICHCLLSFSPNSQKFLQNISYNFSKSSQSK